MGRFSSRKGRSETEAACRHGQSIDECRKSLAHANSASHPIAISRLPLISAPNRPLPKNCLIWKRLLSNMRDMNPTIDGGAESRGPGRPREFAVDDVLDKAIIVFSEYGFHATSMARLTAALGITEGSIYKAFKDKRAIFLAAFERYVSQRNARIAQELASAQTGRACVEAILRLYAEYCHGAVGRRGCLVVGSAVDLASSDADMAKRVASVLKVHEKRLVAAVRQGQGDGSISSRLDAESTGRLLLCVVQGMRVLGKTGRSHGEMMSIVENTLELLN